VILFLVASGKLPRSGGKRLRQDKDLICELGTYRIAVLCISILIKHRPSIMEQATFVIAS
jgi:hypothetical protein